MPKYDSKLEEAFAQRLKIMKAAGEILDWKHHPIAFILGTGRRYTPDFFVKKPEGTLQVIEVKGKHPNVRASRAKWEEAAERFSWFEFVWATRELGSWKHEYYK